MSPSLYPREDHRSIDACIVGASTSKGLPHALQERERSLHVEPCSMWENNKKTLMSDYHKEGLFSCWETKIDVFDEEAQECFSGLGSFLEDRKISMACLLNSTDFYLQVLAR